MLRVIMFMVIGFAVVAFAEKAYTGKSSFSVSSVMSGFEKIGETTYNKLKGLTK